MHVVEVRTPGTSWPIQALKSTTEVHRHNARLDRMFHEASELGFKQSTLVEIGPGAAVAFLSGFLQRPTDKSQTLNEFFFQTARFLESSLRHIPGMPLKSLEPREILSCAEAVENNLIQQLVVVDRDRRVLDAAARALTDSPVNFVRLIQFHLEAELDWIEPKAEMVCAYKCSHQLGRIEALPKRASQMLINGGLLSTTDTIQDESFEVVDHKLGLYKFVGCDDHTNGVR